MMGGSRASRSRENKLMLVLGLAGFVFGGCGHNASLIHETDNGAVATFPVQSEGDILTSPGRRDALRLIGEKCPHGWRLIKEGELAKVSQKADRLWRGQIGSD